MQRTITWMTGTTGHKPVDARPYADSVAQTAFGADLVSMECGINTTVHRLKDPDGGSTG